MRRIIRPRRLPRTLTAVILFAGLAFIGACASAGGAGGSGNQISVRVHNNLIPALNVSISAATDGSTPVRLGSLIGGAEQTFTYNPPIRTGTFRLIADRPGPSGSLVSEPIPLQLDGTGTVSWELSTNNIIIQ